MNNKYKTAEVFIPISQSGRGVRVQAYFGDDLRGELRFYEAPKNGKYLGYTDHIAKLKKLRRMIDVCIGDYTEAESKDD